MFWFLVYYWVREPWWKIELKRKSPGIPHWASKVSSFGMALKRCTRRRIAGTSFQRLSTRLGPQPWQWKSLVIAADLSWAIPEADAAWAGRVMGERRIAKARRRVSTDELQRNPRNRASAGSEPKFRL